MNQVLQRLVYKFIFARTPVIFYRVHFSQNDLPRPYIISYLLIGLHSDRAIQLRCRELNRSGKQGHGSGLRHSHDIELCTLHLYCRLSGMHDKRFSLHLPHIKESFALQLHFSVFHKILSISDAGGGIQPYLRAVRQQYHLFCLQWRFDSDIGYMGTDQPCGKQRYGSDCCPTGQREENFLSGRHGAALFLPAFIYNAVPHILWLHLLFLVPLLLKQRGQRLLFRQGFPVISRKVSCKHPSYYVLQFV